MTPFVAELVGSALLLFFGAGVVANVLLTKSKGEGAGWLVINFGWAMAVFVAVSAVVKISGAHLNPAVTIADAVLTDSWDKLYYIPAQLIGTAVGSAAAWLIYKQHFDATENADLKLAVFATGPAIRSNLYNFITECVATFAFVLAIFLMGDNKATAGKESIDFGAIGALPVALLVLVVGTSLGGPTGYAINPARDLGPRIAHFLLPIKGKRDSDWSYSWIPVVAPIVGAILAALVKKNLL
jgi:glycerol uptake facilitator protein